VGEQEGRAIASPEFWPVEKKTFLTENVWPKMQYPELKYPILWIFKSKSKVLSRHSLFLLWEILQLSVRELQFSTFCPKVFKSRRRWS